MACRVPASDLEGIVEDRLCLLLRDAEAIFEAAGKPSPAAAKSLIERAAGLAHRWPALSPSDKCALLHALVSRVDVRSEAVDITIRTALLPDVLKSGFGLGRLPMEAEGATSVLSVPTRLRRTGMEMKLLVQGASGPTDREADRSLLRLLARARRLHEMVMAGDGKMIRELAAEAGMSPSYFTRVFRLNFLAPQIVKAILLGRQPVGFSAIKLMRAGRLALDWPSQQRELGFE